MSDHAADDFVQQMADALVQLGTKEAMSRMARIMIAVAQHQGLKLEFECELGNLVVEPKLAHQKQQN